MQLGDDSNLCIYDKSGNKVSCMGLLDFFNPTNPVLGFGDSKPYVALHSSGDMCVNNSKGAGGNVACVGTSGLILTTGSTNLGNTSIINVNNIGMNGNLSANTITGTTLNVPNVMYANSQTYGMIHYGGHNDTYLFYPKVTT